MNISIVSGTSKAGKPYEAVKISIGEYEAFIFPNKIELLYIKKYIKDQAHKDFKGDDLKV